MARVRRERVLHLNLKLGSLKRNADGEPIQGKGAIDSLCRCAGERWFAMYDLDDYEWFAVQVSQDYDIFIRRDKHGMLDAYMVYFFSNEVGVVTEFRTQFIEKDLCDVLLHFGLHHLAFNELIKKMKATKLPDGYMNHMIQEAGVAFLGKRAYYKLRIKHAEAIYLSDECKYDLYSALKELVSQNRSMLARASSKHKKILKMITRIIVNDTNTEVSGLRENKE